MTKAYEADPEADQVEGWGSIIREKASEILTSMKHSRLAYIRSEAARLAVKGAGKGVMVGVPAGLLVGLIAEGGGLTGGMVAIGSAAVGAGVFGIAGGLTGSLWGVISSMYDKEGHEAWKDAKELKAHVKRGGTVGIF